jgi:hypothetical protein
MGNGLRLWMTQNDGHKPKTRKGNQIMKNRNIHFKPTLELVIPVLLACFALLPRAQATPDTALPGFNTADGTNALGSVTTGVANSAFGWFSLFSNTDGAFNTGVGAGTLLFNIGDQTTSEGVSNTASIQHHRLL